MLPYLESWHFIPHDERLTPVWLSHNGKREMETEGQKCQQKWVEEKKGMNKGKGGQDGEFHVNTVCRDSCQGEVHS